MQTSATIEPVDYLIIGHITQDVTPEGLVLGGTASYASLTAKAFDKRVGIVTACSPELNLSYFDGVTIHRKNSEHTSTFHNIYTAAGRTQYILHVAEKLSLEDVPVAWRTAPIVHLGPLTGEIGPDLPQAFPNSLVGITPQGWMRAWNGEGIVEYKPWQDADKVLPHIQAVVMSIEDVRGDEDIVATFAGLVPILVVTEAAAGARIYWNGDLRRISAPKEEELDPVGAGDVFAASFFITLHKTRDPWEAARIATAVAANSVTRKGILGVPSREEVLRFSSQIIEN